MREVGTFEAKTHLSQLLDEVAGGDEVIITRRGKPVAMLVAVDAADKVRRMAALDRIAALRSELRSKGQGMTRGDILAARDAGRR